MSSTPLTCASIGAATAFPRFPNWPGIGRAHRHNGQRDFPELRDRQGHIADATNDGQNQRNHRRQFRARDKKG